MEEQIAENMSQESRYQIELLQQRIRELEAAEAERQQIEAAVGNGQDRYRRLLDTSPDSILILDQNTTILFCNQRAVQLYGCESVDDVLGKNLFQFSPREEQELLIASTQQALRENEIRNIEYELSRCDGTHVSIEVNASLVGTRNNQARIFIAVVRDITMQKRAHAQIEQQLQRLAALRTIDMAITGSLDQRVTLAVILDQVTSQQQVDAAAVLLLNPHTQMLEYAASRGFRSQTIRQTRLRLGEGHAGRAALERRMLTIPNLSGQHTFRRSELIAGEDFKAYYAAPLIAKGQVKGVLEIFHRVPLDPTQDWFDFLEALTGQTAIAIDNAMLFDDLQRSNTELALAYDTTLEGWSRALDLRDKETEGHTQRVTEMTVHLAQAMGLSDSDLVQIRRGALLHDIGKMGVPDAILLKPGPLNDEEWLIMHKHPIYAYELLAPISYLHPALDIPYCHHEKWDGTGYPRGLKGEQIPLAARIFAVVDVWDALRSDRPYRQGWPQEQTRSYIQNAAGTHFDPRVVQRFLDMMRA